MDLLLITHILDGDITYRDDNETKAQNPNVSTNCCCSHLIKHSNI